MVSEKQRKARAAFIKKYAKKGRKTLLKKQTKKTQITRNITSSHPHVSQYCSMIGIFAAALANTLGDEDTCADIANIKKIN